MEKLYSKFFGGEYKNFYGHNISTFNSSSSKNKSYQLNNNNTSDNQINNQSTINPQLQQNESINQYYSSKSPNIIKARPVNFTKNDFVSFDTFAFQNSQAKKPQDRNFAPATLQMQILGEKIRNIENKYKEDKNQLMEIIQKNILNNQSNLNATAKSQDLNKKKKKIGHKIKKEITNLQKTFRSDSDEEIQEEDKSLRITHSVENSFISKKNNLIETVNEINQNNQIKKENNFNIISSNPIPIPLNRISNNNNQYNNLYNDSEKVTYALKKIRDDLIFHLQDQSLSNKDNFDKIEINFDKLKNDVCNKVNYLENKQRLQLETLRYILEHSGDKRLRDVTAKVLDGIINLYNVLGVAFEDMEKEQPRKTKEEFRTTSRSKGKSRRQGMILSKDKLVEVAAGSDNETNEIMGYIEARKSMNRQLQQDIMKEDKIEIEDNPNRNKEKLAGIKDKILQKQKIQTEKLAKEIEKYKNNNYPKLVHVVMAANKFINSKFNKDKDAMSYSLNIFINYYEQMDSSLNQWVFSCIRMPFLSIINVENLDLNLTNFGSMMNGIIREAENTYIRLETRLKGFLKNLNDTLQDEKIDMNLIAYLNILITDESYIPKEFFVLFEYSRINTEENFLKKLTDEQKQMILAIYIFCKIICKNILIEGNFSQGLTINTRTKNNFKTCATVIYRGVIDYFKGKCKILRNIENLAKFTDTMNQNQFNLRKKLWDEGVKRPSNEVDKSYLNACRKYESKNRANRDSIITNKDLGNLKKIKGKMPKFDPDSNPNEIEIINKQVFTLKELSGYKNIAEKHKFDISNEIVEFVNRFISYINLKKQKN